jgi:hypothetical protein
MPVDAINAVDPILINLAVLREIPEYCDLDTRRYVRQVDELAQSIDVRIRAEERLVTLDDPLYRHDRDLWRVGGMAIALAGMGISYTSDPLDPRDLSQSFVPGLLDTKCGTCASMPILYLGIAHRLGWPMKAVVGTDHMWTRWDDGSKEFNLEATDVESGAGEGSFASPPDSFYIECQQLDPLAIEVGSDMKSLNNRELLGVCLQMRAAYWAAHDRWDLAEQDLLLAHHCYPMNRDIFMFLHKAMAMRAGHILTEVECQMLPEFFEEISVAARGWYAEHPEYEWDTVAAVGPTRDNAKE